MRKNLAIRLAPLLALGFLIPPAHVLAATFVISVPVNVMNIPEKANGFDVRCVARYQDIADWPDPPQVRSRTVPFLHPSTHVEAVGSYSGTVSVKVVVDDELALQVVGFQCGLSLAADNTPPKSWDQCVDEGLDPTRHPLLCGAKGKPVSAKVEVWR